MKVLSNFLYNDFDVKVQYIPSPNVYGIKKGYKVLVVHFDGSSGTQGLNWLLDKSSKVSSELWLSREGKTIQLAPLNVRCAHAGVSEWRGIDGMNSYGIGIEIQNTGSQQYTDIQMVELGKIAKTLVSTYGLEIVGHEDIAPLRKIDPSGSKRNLFDWKRLFDDAGVHTELYKTTADLNVRICNGTEYKAINKFKKDTFVYELNRVGNWSKVQEKCTLNSGWVHNGYLIK